MARNRPVTQPRWSSKHVYRAGGGGADWWDIGTPVAAYNAIGADTKVESYTNLVDPYTYDASPPGGPTWDAVNGWTFDGDNSEYLETGISSVPVTWSAIILFSDLNVAVSTQSIFGGLVSASNIFLFQPRTSGNNRVYYSGGSRSVSGNLTGGTMAIAGKEAYLDGATDGTISAGATTSTQSLLIGALNNAGTPQQFTYGKIQAIAIYSDTLTAGEVSSLHTAISAQSANWWVVAGKTCVAAYQPKGASSYAHSLTNLANPGTYDATAPTGPTWANGTGWTFDGSTQYLTTGVTPVNDQTWSMMARFSGLTVGYNAVAGSFSNVGGNHWFALQPNRTGNTLGYFSGFYTLVAPGLAAGTAAVAGTQGYRDGSSDGGSISSVAGAFPAMYIGALNADGVPSGYINGNLQALYIGSATLSAGDVSTLHTRMTALE